MRTYLNTLLHRKRGAYGPLWIFELDPETWAVVWRGWLEDEATCHLILSEDPAWFNRDWGMDGRRPNPTYKTRRAALEEVVRSLRAMKVDLKDDNAEQRKYDVYISDAEHDLHGVQTSELHPGEATVLVLENALAASEAPGAAQASKSAQPAVEAEKTPPAPAPQAVEAKHTTKPWDNPTDKPTGLNFQPPADLHAKMNWVCENVPQMSRLRILREGAMMFCDAMIEKHYKEAE